MKPSGTDGGDSSIEWTYSGNKVLCGLSVYDTNLVCAYETSTYDTVTDSFASTEWVDGGNTEEDREILAPGKSVVGGIAYIACATGTQSGVFEFPGEESGGSLWVQS